MMSCHEMGAPNPASALPDSQTPLAEDHWRAPDNRCCKTRAAVSCTVNGGPWADSEQRRCRQQPFGFLASIDLRQPGLLFSSVQLRVGRHGIVKEGSAGVLSVYRHVTPTGIHFNGNPLHPDTQFVEKARSLSASGFAVVSSFSP